MSEKDAVALPATESTGTCFQRLYTAVQHIAFSAKPTPLTRTRTQRSPQNLALTSPFSNSPTIPHPANVHRSLTNPSVTAPLIIPLRA